MKQTVQQIAIANLMLLCCCAVFSTPVPAAGGAQLQILNQRALLLSQAALSVRQGTAELRNREHATGDYAVNAAADELERLLNQLRSGFNLRPGKPAKDQKAPFHLTFWLHQSPKAAVAVITTPEQTPLIGGDVRLPHGGTVFLQPVRAGPGSRVV